MREVRNVNVYDNIKRDKPTYKIKSSSISYSRDLH